MKTIFRLTAAFVFLQMIVMRTVGAEETDAVEVKSVRKPVALPGLIVNFEKRCVDLEARVCLDAGYLELIACTQGTKEHESIVSVSSKALHIHTALLLLGADSGHPEMRKLVDEKTERWVNLAPRGDPVEVMLVLGSNEGKMVEKPISDFVQHSKSRLDEVDGQVLSAPDGKEKNRQVDGNAAELSKTFLFAGSRLRDAGAGPKQYLADLSGNVISIATFGDEVLCLPTHQTQQNSALMWQVKPGVVPEVGTAVTLRLRVQESTPRLEVNRK